MLTFVGLAVGTHSVVHLQFALQRVDELPAFAELLLQQRDLVLQPEDKRQRVSVVNKKKRYDKIIESQLSPTCWFSPGWPAAPASGCGSALPALDCEPAGASAPPSTALPPARIV